MPLRIKLGAGAGVIISILLMIFFVSIIYSCNGIWKILAIFSILLEIAGIVVFLEMFVPSINIFTTSICKGRGNLKYISLTFDDGPSKDITPRLLDILNNYGVKATFFILGKHISGNEEIIKRMHKEGHEIGNHGFSHRKMNFMGRKKIEDEITKTEELIIKLTNCKPGYLRTPHGFLNPFVGAVSKKKGYKIIAWSKGVWDTDENVTADQIISRTLSKIKLQEILLLHDAHGNNASRVQNATLTALPHIIEELRSRGFTFVTISEMLSKQ